MVHLIFAVELNIFVAILLIFKPKRSLINNRFLKYKANCQMHKN